MDEDGVFLSEVGSQALRRLLEGVVPGVVNDIRAAVTSKKSSTVFLPSCVVTCNDVTHTITNLSGFSILNV